VAVLWSADMYTD